MQAPAFWWRDRSLAAPLLAPLAAVYGWIAARRMRQRGCLVGIPVLCVGDPTVGGSGKTPAALLIGRLLTAAGERPFFLSRGYGGARRGPVVVDPDRDTAAQIGDEPLLLARIAPTVVARDRPAGARLARQRGASVIVMDDGFQNPSLHKDLRIIVIDGRRAIGNAKVFPAGPLRAPFDVQIDRVEALIVVGEMVAAASLVAKAVAHGVSVFHGRIEPDPQALPARDRDVLAFAGIADPEKFFRALGTAGFHVQAGRVFPDHHRYDESDAARLLAEAERRDLRLITTEKDLVRLHGDSRLEVLAARTEALKVDLVLARSAEFADFVLDAVRAKRQMIGRKSDAL